jgi:hypothetical protein
MLSSSGKTRLISEFTVVARDAGWQPADHRDVPVG